MNKTKTYAQELLDRLKDIDRGTVESFYEMGRLLSALERDKLWEVLEYPSFRQMLYEEMSFNPETGYRYMQTYRHFRRLKYNKKEALHIMHTFSFTSISKVIASFKEKKGVVAIRNAVDHYNKNHKQVNFAMTEEEWAATRKVLEQHGAEYDVRSNRLLNASYALLVALGIIEDQEEAA